MDNCNNNNNKKNVGHVLINIYYHLCIYLYFVLNAFCH